MKARMAGFAGLVIGVVAGLVAGDESRVPKDVRTEIFATSMVCGTCHGNADDSGALLDNQGRGIAPYDLWRGSMMANAARDPFFRAAVVAEVAAAPAEEKEAIEARCLHCHAPMASVEARRAGGAGLAFAALDREDEEEHEKRAALARDGVSCTLCHQITAANAGTPKAFDGGFVVGEGREIFGPHDDQFGLPMQRVTDYWPVLGEHVAESAHCAGCHVETLPGGGYESATFLEWRNSAHRATSTCQSCHVPQTSEGGVPIRTRISRTTHGGDILFLAPREPVGRHLFVGGNTLIPAILRDHADALHVKAPREAFDATIEAARRQLQERTARIVIEEARRDDDLLHIVVGVRNLAGHKFPTGHASRRAWLRLRVLNADEEVVWASGEADAQGRLIGANGVLASERAGGPVQPHRFEIAERDEVQVYEAVLGDEAGKAAFRHHGARRFAKDNRLLPSGWDAKHADAKATAPAGVEDDDFGPGGDCVVYSVPFPTDELTFTVEAALLYQPVSARYAAELFETDHPEVKRFQAWFEAADRRPEVVARARVVGGPD
jgi:hypothetical protein